MSGAKRVDVTIIGAGMVGSATACLLARCGFSVALVEGREPPAFDAASDYGLRVSALSPGSQSILGEAGAWSGIAAQRHCVYHRMEIEDREGGPVLDFDAPAFGLDHLGAIVENDLVSSNLWQTAQGQALVEIYCPDRLEAFTDRDGGIRATLASGASIDSSLLIGADGARSGVRKLAGSGQDIWSYNQEGLVCTLATTQPHQGIAWQRFLEGGPLAFLPLADGRSSIVWTLSIAQAQHLLALDSEAFNFALADASGGRLGGIQGSGARATFPLAMRLSHRHVAGRTVLLGDSAHVVHPLAGQGVNLGLADAAALVESLINNRQMGRDIADPSSLRRYERWRKSESGLMSWGIHGLGALFGPDSLAPLRRLGLGMVSRSWLAREAFVRRAAGVNRNAPGLARGKTLQSLIQKPAYKGPAGR